MAEDELRPNGSEERVAAEVSLARRVLNVRTIGSLIFAIVLIALLVRAVGANLDETLATIARANPLLLVAAFVAYYLTFPLRGFRWNYILGRVGTHVPYAAATEILFLSWFVNCVVPAKLGDVYRAYLLKANFRASISRTLGTVFIERIADIVVIFGLALAAGFWSFRGRNRPEVDALFLAGFAFAVVLVLLVIGLRFFGLHLTRFLPARVADLYERFHEGSTGALTTRSIPLIIGVTGLIWLLEGVRLYFVIHALNLSGIGLGISSSVFVALGAALLTAIPLTPGGMGFVQAGVVGLLGIYGV
ncbi:MAG TPA: lysylphosphatidylglycerol synthase transmembrane domain-containing protein, partial [Candidatus Limnocylindria bacterium]|nr:lysylphosphatidylglycerol synthase transmembrane domain-containing protein [Candidatus Limnocylindria bacterium]